VSLTIGEVAQRTGLNATTLRYYEDVGLIPAPARESGQRRYEDEALDLITVITAAKEAGFTLDEIADLVGQMSRTRPDRTWRKLATAKQAELRQQIQRLEAMVDLLDGLARCECESIAECAARLDGRT
jgi:MerR family redox-sensitive transcriptional activator SoxR